MYLLLKCCKHRVFLCLSVSNSFQIWYRDGRYEPQNVLTNNGDVYITQIMAWSQFQRQGLGYDKFFFLKARNELKSLFHPMLIVSSNGDTVFFLVLLTLYKEEKVHWYSSGNSMPFLSIISGWYIGPEEYPNGISLWRAIYWLS